MVVTDVIQTITYKAKDVLRARLDATRTIVQSYLDVSTLTEDVFLPVTRLTENARLGVTQNGMENNVINSAVFIVPPEYVIEMTVVVQSDVKTKKEVDANVETHAVVIV